MTRPGSRYAEVADQLIRDTGYLECLKRSCGSPEEELNRTSNVGEFIQSIHQHQQDTRGKGLRDFLDSVALDDDFQRESDKDKAAKKPGVWLITLHASKGLEYPVVYLPFPAQYRKADEPLWHDRESLHLRYDLEGNEDSLARADEERLAEDMRLLYVGLTRAVHCCVLGVAGIVHGSSKKSDVERTAFG